LLGLSESVLTAYGLWYSARMTLRKHIGTWGLTSAAIGGMVGSGWLFGPFYVAKLAGPSAFLAWILGGILMMFVAMTFSELASAFPMVGGTVRFMQLSHGPLVSFTMGWIGWLSAAAVAPIETMALLQYANNYLPWLMHTVSHVQVLTGVGIFVGVVLLFVMCLLNVFGVKLLSKTNSTVVVIKLIVPILTMILLFAYAFKGANFTHARFFAGGWKGLLNSLPTAGVIFSFIGYSPAIQLSGEAKNPQRSIPIAIIGALLFCILLYVALQISFVGALKPSYYMHGWSALSFTDVSGPFAGIAMTVGLIWLVKLIYIDALVSPFGTALIYTASTARIGYAQGENGYLPNALHELNSHGVPARFIAVNFFVGIILFLPFPSWQHLVGFLVSALVFAYGVGPLALNVLRKKMPEQERPFKVPAPQVMCLIAFFICNLIIYWTGWVIVWKMLVAIAIGYIYLLCFKMTPRGKALILQWQKAWWIFVYLIMLGLVSWFGSFGGGLDMLPFGWDFLVIAVVSAIVYGLSQYCAY